MADRTAPSTASLIGILALFLAIGGVATYFLWPNLSHILYGRVEDVSLPGLLGGGIGLAAVLWALGRWVRGLAA